MKPKNVATLTTILIILFFGTLMTACVSTPATAPAPVPTPALMRTDKATGVGNVQGITVEDLAKLIAERTTVPSPTPGAVNRMVEQVATESGLAGKTFLGWGH